MVTMVTMKKECYISITIRQWQEMAGNGIQRTVIRPICSSPNDLQITLELYSNVVNTLLGLNYRTPGLTKSKEQGVVGT